MVERSFIWLKGALYGLKTKILKNALAHSLLERKARISTRESKLKCDTKKLVNINNMAPTGKSVKVSDKPNSATRQVQAVPDSR